MFVIGKHWHIKASSLDSYLQVISSLAGDERKPANQISCLMDRDEERRREERVIVVVMNLQDYVIVFFMNGEERLWKRKKGW